MLPHEEQEFFEEIESKKIHTYGKIKRPKHSIKYCERRLIFLCSLEVILFLIYFLCDVSPNAVKAESVKLEAQKLEFIDSEPQRQLHTAFDDESNDAKPVYTSLFGSNKTPQQLFLSIVVSFCLVRAVLCVTFLVAIRNSEWVSRTKELSTLFKNSSDFSNLCPEQLVDSSGFIEPTKKDLRWMFNAWKIVLFLMALLGVVSCIIYPPTEMNDNSQRATKQLVNFIDHVKKVSAILACLADPLILYWLVLKLREVIKSTEKYVRDCLRLLYLFRKYENTQDLIHDEKRYLEFHREFTVLEENLDEKTQSLWAAIHLLKPYFWSTSLKNKISDLETETKLSYKPYFVRETSIQTIKSTNETCGFWNESNGVGIYRLLSLVTWICLIFSKIFSLTSPILLGWLVQDVTERQYDSAFWLALGYAGCLLMTRIFKEAQSALYIKVQQRAYIELQDRIYRHILKLPFTWHSHKQTGALLRSLDRGGEASNSLMTYGVLYLFPALAECIVVGFIFCIHFTSRALTAVLVGSLLTYIVSTITVAVWRTKFRASANQHDNRIHTCSSNALINFEAVKSNAMEEFEIARFNSAIREYQVYGVKTQLSLNMLNILQQFIQQIAVLGSLIISIQHVRSGSMTIGQLVTATTYLINMFVPLMFLGSIYMTVVKSLTDLMNLADILKEPLQEERTALCSSRFATGPNRGHAPSIEFRDVHYKYPSQPVKGSIRGLSFEIPSGSTCAIVGATGAGKTTLSRMLFRFLEPTKGQIYVDDKPINSYSKEFLRKNFAIVPQDTVLFSDTIEYNLRYGSIDAPEELVRDAAEKAQLLNFIEGLPEGWQTKVGERGVRLSGGEKQRIAIARCILKNAPLIILDEATSSLDRITEISIHDVIKKLQDTIPITILLIAHKLGSCVHADQILVMDDGRIVQNGTHDELLKSPNGLYAQMWQKSQTETNDT